MRIKGLIILTLIFTMLSAAFVYADWYNADVSELHIATPQDMAEFAEAVNTGNNMENKTIFLDNDIDLDEFENWTPIGFDTDNYFAGNFDGQNHVISNLHITRPKGYFNGLFGILLQGSISNVKLANVDINIDELDFSRDETTPMAVGGLVGMQCGSVMMCQNLGGRVSLISPSSNDCVAGLIGFATDLSSNLDISIYYCSNSADVSATNGASGIVCTFNSNNYNYINYCVNNGNITSANSTATGIAKSVCGDVYTCSNTGRLTGENVNGITCAVLNSGNIKSRVYSCVDFYPNDYYVICLGDYSVAHNAKGENKINMTAIGDDLAGENTSKAIDFDNMTQAEMLEALREEEINTYNMWITTTNTEYPALWWEPRLTNAKRFGDVTGEGDLSPRDTALILKYIAGIAKLDSEQALAADFDENGVVDLLDVIKLQNDSRYYPETDLNI